MSDHGTDREAQARERCSFDGCRNPVNARGLCSTHGRQMRLYGRLTPVRPRELATRFWSKVNKDGPIPSHVPDLGPCWVWTASVSRNGVGYGRINVTGSSWTAAHRLSWEIENGAVPNGMFVCHRCDNRRCVRASHLFLGTQADNTADMLTKGREARGSKMGLARLTEDMVKDARRKYSDGVSSLRIAESLGVHRQTVMNAIHRVSWRHV